MALQTSGTITFEQIQAEFGGSNPVGLEEYYAGGAYVPSSAIGSTGVVPSSGLLTIENFYGTAKVPATGYTDAGNSSGPAGANTVWTVPAGVYRISIIVIGGGGGGGVGYNGYSGGSGGSGSYSYLNNITVTPGDTFSFGLDSDLTVNGGIAFASGAAGEDPLLGFGRNGQSTYLFSDYNQRGDNIVVTANGGQGGQGTGNVPSGSQYGGGKRRLDVD